MTVIAAAAYVAACSPAPGGNESTRADQALSIGTSASLDGLLTSTLLFSAADADRDGLVVRDELRAATGAWFMEADAAQAGAVTREQLEPVLNAALPLSGLAAAFNMGGAAAQPQTPEAASVAAMTAALPASAPASPASPRRVLVLARAAGFVHSSIPLAAATIDALGQKTGAWTTTISYDAADVTAENLRQFDAVFLASTTGAFLDDPADAAATAARRRALLEFVRGGKGLAGIHAATDAYHEDSAPPAAGGGIADLFKSFSAGGTLASLMLAQGDSNSDERLDRPEVEALADAWYRTLDSDGAGRLTQADFALFGALVPQSPAAAAQGPDTQVGTWADYNRMIGGFFKYHWLDPQLVTVRIDDPTSPLTAMFDGQSFDIRDEIYTMAADSWSRDNVRVLTSIDYDRMSEGDRALEDYPRADRDYGLSWIRREGEGRVFYMALGHSERIYANTPMLEHLLAGMQYAIGDLQADDTPVPR